MIFEIHEPFLKQIETEFERVGGVYALGASQFSPLTATETAGIESTLCSNLPPEYVAFLKNFGAVGFNGESDDNPFVFVRCESELPSYISSNRRAIVRSLYGKELREQIVAYRGRIPRELIPIGEDGGAGQFCLGLSGDFAYKVFYWDQADEPMDPEDYESDFGVPPPETERLRNIYLVAHDFLCFLKAIESGPAENHI